MLKELQNPGEAEVRTYFVRDRNALVARSHFSELFVAYYLHLAGLRKQQKGKVDTLFKEVLAAFVLHCASRPRNESIAWTINFQEPLANVFITGNNDSGTIVGKVFSEHVQCSEKGMFFSEVRGKGDQRSTISLEPGSGFFAIEQYYTQSEQRRGRFFEIFTEEFVLVTAQPDCDLMWLESLNTKRMQSLDVSEDLSLLEKRWYRWECGCDQTRILEAVAPAARNALDHFFGTSAAIRTECPRCGMSYLITREAMEAFLQGSTP